MSDFPKALYKGERYSDWMVFCDDVAKGKVQSVTVPNAAQEKNMRAEGFTDAAELMQPLNDVALTVSAAPKKRGMPKGGWPKKNVNSK